MTERRLWLNGSLVDEDKARISPIDRGFQYGDGLFETIRAENGRPLYLERHIARLAGSAGVLGITGLESVQWQRIIQSLIRENQLFLGSARIKIMVTRGKSAGLGLPKCDNPTILVTAHPYTPPTKEQYQAGWSLITSRQGFSPPLAMHKTLNYLFFMVARQEAVDAGADEAVIVDPDGFISETAVGSLLVNGIDGWWTPKTKWGLPGTTLKTAINVLAQENIIVSFRHGSPEELAGAECAFVLNAMMGAMPVKSIDGKPLEMVAFHTAKVFRDAYLNEE